MIDDLGVYKTDNHRLTEFNTANGRIVVSYAKKGEAMDCHFAAEKGALKHMKEAINAFSDAVFMEYEWCTMIMAVIVRPSVERLVKKCQFEYLTEGDGKKVYVRLKNG